MIIRRPLREQIYETLLERIENGSYIPGERLSDVNIATDLSVSRTPAREALLRLESDGVVGADPGYGFAIRPLSVLEIREKYPILSALEALALRISPLPSDQQLEKLNNLNDSMADWNGAVVELVEIDEAWHRALLANCQNRSLIEVIAGIKTTLRRYEVAYMRDSRRKTVSTNHHYQIVISLKEGDLETALDWLDRNWIQTTEELSAWLEENQAGN
ncbi:MAG: GntR family transcriptional regulator [Pyrinomonadaceae bacterium]